MPATPREVLLGFGSKESSKDSSSDLHSTLLREVLGNSGRGRGPTYLRARRKCKTYAANSWKRNNKVDMLILRNTKNVLEARTSMHHTAATLQNAFTRAGTTSDVFLRENIERLAPFTRVYKGHVEKGMNVLGPYLPLVHPYAYRTIERSLDHAFELGTLDYPRCRSFEGKSLLAFSTDNGNVGLSTSNVGFVPEYATGAIFDIQDPICEAGKRGATALAWVQDST
ncbi:uncharacterized protein HD556DRAFT_1537429 [Suillus plorans]|uniref:Uncharacterized protein n=1 Tax=Suillus plorans TaxID=116603 RepID=A0A9P7DER2_9AGAM|nr:uncharacterized protein HD556DRAFT_1537429 [Suillus plorans]KAG1791212.1 hypothetical protein HD556DRAFT_1537429 [Suillus plorans]